MDPKQIVAGGYDEVWSRYEEWPEGDEARMRWLTRAMAFVPRRGRAVDLGCSTGSKATRMLAEEFASVVGVDISAKSLKVARWRLPSVTFLNADMTTLTLPPASFDLVTAFYSMIHVPRGEQPGLVCSIADWLRPGGILLATLGCGDADSVYEENWLGAPMFWSSWDTATSRAMITDAGLELVATEEEMVVEDGQPITFHWVIARRPVS